MADKEDDACHHGHCNHEHHNHAPKPEIKAATLEEIKATVAGFAHGQTKTLQRERACRVLVQQLRNFNSEQPKRDVTKYLVQQMQDMSESEHWEQRQAAFWIAKALIESNFDDTMHRSVQKMIKDHLEDIEPRVRLAVADLIEELAKSHGLGVWTSFNRQIMAVIEANFDREDTEPGVQEEDRELGTIKKTHLKHDTEGWKALETAVKTLLRIITGIGPDFLPNINLHFLHVIYTYLGHKNRYVRETAFQICAAICDLASPELLNSFGSIMAPKLVLGVQDDWSQVAYPAIRALRSLLVAAQKQPALFTQLAPVGIPPLCAARHHPADGVKHCALECWKEVVGMNGRMLLATNVKQTVAYYVGQLKQDNESLREAACWSIGELASKIDSSAVAPFAAELIAAILPSLKDHSWPVADAASSALGELILSFPDEIPPVFDNLVAGLNHCLSHFVWSVRENAAIALGNLIRTQPPQLTLGLITELRHHLAQVLTQPVDENILHTGEDRFGPHSKKVRDNDPHLHTGQPIFSCECHSKNHEPGCLNFTGASPIEVQPWHWTDGSVFLLRELSEIQPDVAANLLEQLAAAAAVAPTFAHYTVLKQNIWKQLPIICQNVGIARASRFISLFLPSLIASLEDDNKLLASTAAACLNELLLFFGQSLSSLVSPKHTQMVTLHARNAPKGK